MQNYQGNEASAQKNYAVRQIYLALAQAMNRKHAKYQMDVNG